MKYMSKRVHRTAQEIIVKQTENPPKTRLKISRSLELFACTKIWRAFSFKKED